MPLPQDDTLPVENVASSSRSTNTNLEPSAGEVLDKFKQLGDEAAEEEDEEDDDDEPENIAGPSSAGAGGEEGAGGEGGKKKKKKKKGKGKASKAVAKLRSVRNCEEG